MDAMRWQDECLHLLDQTKLPREEVYVECWDHQTVAAAIKSMKVRGAPAIGAAAAFGTALAALNYHEEDDAGFSTYVREAMVELGKTRPTAVNLFWALSRMAKRLDKEKGNSVATQQQALVQEAKDILAEDKEMNERMGQFGNELIPEGVGILTHCNAGALATAGYGTALGVIRAAHEAGKAITVFADETRPLLQGARLTAWELKQDNIPVTLITDSMAADVMKRGFVDLVIVGADRIAANGDVANKIGTYGVAILARAHNLPFYVAAPTSTFDLELASGQDIPIEQRDSSEVMQVGEQILAPEGVDIYNPAFDVTPGQLITAIITDQGVIYPPYTENILKVLNVKSGTEEERQ